MSLASILTKDDKLANVKCPVCGNKNKDFTIEGSARFEFGEAGDMTIIELCPGDVTFRPENLCRCEICKYQNSLNVFLVEE